MFRDAVTEAQEALRLDAITPHQDKKLAGRGTRATQGEASRVDGEGGPAQARTQIGCCNANASVHLRHARLLPSLKLLQANRPVRPIEWKYRMRARAFLARSKHGGRLGRGDRDVGPNLEGQLTFRPAWGRIAARFETDQAAAPGGGPGRPAVIDRLAGTDRELDRPRATGISAKPRRQRHARCQPDLHGDIEQPRHQGLGGSNGPVLDSDCSHTAANSTDVTINNESMTFQLFRT